jgi:hypothetical protein
MAKEAKKIPALKNCNKKKKIHSAKIIHLPTAGLEPATFALGGQRHIH